MAFSLCVYFNVSSACANELQNNVLDIEKKNEIEVDFYPFHNHCTIKLSECVNECDHRDIWRAPVHSLDRRHKFNDGIEHFLRRWLTNEIPKQSSSSTDAKKVEREWRTKKTHTRTNQHSQNADIKCIWFFFLSFFSSLQYFVASCIRYMDILSFWWNRICRARLQYFSLCIVL